MSEKAISFNKLLIQSALNLTTIVNQICFLLRIKWASKDKCGKTIQLKTFLEYVAKHVPVYFHDQWREMMFPTKLGY